MKFLIKPLCPVIFALGILSGCTKAERGVATNTQPSIHARSHSASIHPGDLMNAVIANDGAKLSALLEAGADVDDPLVQNGETITPLLIAIIQYNEAIARTLLAHGANTHLTYMGYSARDLAFFLNQDNLAREMDNR